MLKLKYIFFLNTYHPNKFPIIGFSAINNTWLCKACFYCSTFLIQKTTFFVILRIIYSILYNKIMYNIFQMQLIYRRFFKIYQPIYRKHNKKCWKIMKEIYSSTMANIQKHVTNIMFFVHIPYMYIFYSNGLFYWMLSSQLSIEIINGQIIIGILHSLSYRMLDT